MVEYRTLGAFNPAAVKDLDRSIIDEAADDRIRGFQALAAHDREELKAAYERIEELEAALKHAQEALFWYGGMGFEMDGRTIGAVMEEALP